MAAKCLAGGARKRDYASEFTTIANQRRAIYFGTFACRICALSFAHNARLSMFLFFSFFCDGENYSNHGEPIMAPSPVAKARAEL